MFHFNNTQNKVTVKNTNGKWEFFVCFLFIYFTFHFHTTKKFSYTVTVRNTNGKCKFFFFLAFHFHTTKKSLIQSLSRIIMANGSFFLTFHFNITPKKSRIHRLCLRLQCEMCEIFFLLLSCPPPKKTKNSHI